MVSHQILQPTVPLYTINWEFFYSCTYCLKNNGITKNLKNFNNYNLGPWYYEQQTIGYNFRMNDIMAALGISQLKRLDSFVEKRHKLKLRYDKLLSKLPLIIPYQGYEIYSSLHLYPVLLSLSKINKTKLEIFNGLREGGIGVNTHYIPIHFQPYSPKASD